ncbi:MAG: NAD(P)H-hydrate dehydratase [Methylobacter sp.]|nr:NAD(P)H-hydrate dehydratase [Methylobacter sp.]MDP2099042.1 NAD(P)H-hydrate dehydratase [Methylobacter sp.]MDP2428263.1 NAD(P)H-hydrate dehydratase [Methylobacter sp.]MDP3055230.1 NAD(P)H-hydrate dehydratase [Methylobacter sp.]MDP3362065.1 NAD(P)H-hydrate dehydratase [Methylobacter sp.]
MQNLPIKLYRAAQVRELDRIAIEEYGIPGFELMHQAGTEVFQRLMKQWPEVRSVAVFCGSGNNAGDGYIIAGLALAAGLGVRVYTLSDPEQLGGDALTAYQHYKGIVTSFQAGQVINADVLVDALLGTGLDRPVTGLYAEAIQVINAHSAPVIAVDIPSGLQADTGSVMGCAVKAAYTVTFIGLKQGLFTGQAADYCGEIFYAQLTVPDKALASVNASATRVLKAPLPRRDRCAHKGNCGHVLIVGGDLGYSGAAKMAGEAALRVGAGLVSLATRAGHAALMNLNRPELMCHGVENAEQLAVLLAKADVVVIGPGLGQGAWATALFNVAISAGKPMVIDADGLNLLAANPATQANWILTPHSGEAARLLNCQVADIQQDRFAAALSIQAKYGGVAIVKGAGTLIATAHQLAVSNTGNPGMASGGMGDVLAGAIAGLLAQGLSLPDAAQQGVYNHGLAADLAAANDGERGLLASDLMPYLRQLVNE